MPTCSLRANSHDLVLLSPLTENKNTLYIKSSTRGNVDGATNILSGGWGGVRKKIDGYLDENWKTRRPWTNGSTSTLIPEELDNFSKHGRV